MRINFPDGMVAECTPEEFKAIRHLLGGTVQSGQEASTKPTNGNPQIWNETSARLFWDSLDPIGRQKKVLLFIIKRNGRATHDELMNLLGVKSGQALAGVLANISRNARRETGVKKARVVDWMSDGKGGCYYIPDGVLQLLKHFE
jgi:hypothetical protein